MADLRSRWKKTKEASEREHGTAEHLELPDIIIKHEMTYEAPQGEANADRAMPLPRPLVGCRTTAPASKWSSCVVSLLFRIACPVNFGPIRPEHLPPVLGHMFIFETAHYLCSKLPPRYTSVRCFTGENCGQHAASVRAGRDAG